MSERHIAMMTPNMEVVKQRPMFKSTLTHLQLGGQAIC